ncbi:MAG TPA: bifunctional [glutamate--ammonia ligase]-adenylyl-L-tyrosine phosphorylase/[glutamate--ammonia-ligase] adenylyltransferase [Arenimonas sp.]|uniref:bifunctional [glutamate--ammonia ligase]-adenylyl-L-tyrosine phosphorylase/[glutamate--ammonia-ligase] adenylyltransferase n=1 Tax=Arenimonas sp. TaxID=1872635 RepID=UPI002B81D312|nr:bifunctional [glutamate--ammonia ligase]-adenylyl-L-tyrosine phosphorylase/[glutamate--ammonia-ligase] adenylyltransferase [Arenimonas sp.]HMB55652.1 bifunctional [glutamate--ammonia ligase]-adenylyl-L-tyrosine phosphorylase/[glutamate--ammonia-ligase] adenylyltransferase [Arenimonas sp.]
MAPASNPTLSAVQDRAFARLRQACPEAFADPVQAEKFSRLALASDFAVDTLCRQPGLCLTLDDAAQPPPLLPADDEAQWPGLLRRWRAGESARLIWRDLSGADTVDDTLAGSSRIAEQALAAALSALSLQFQARHGAVRDAQGAAQSLVVFGLGKLGGGELNFSSDIDLVYAFADHGVSDGARPLDAEAYFTRIGQRLAQLLGEVTAEGFSHRVDLRLRPFGSSGRIALSFAAMEQYYQREGRDWERYAWIKARPVAGDIAAGEHLLDTLRPFIYRRYLDYSALDGLREMKALIDAEVQKRELAEHIKLGPGGIREVEFLVQALQLIRGGREAALRQRSLLPALAALADAGYLPLATTQALAQAYRFLRRLENRVQMFADQQVHALPEDEAARLRIALALGYADTAALLVELDAHRAVVSEAFEGLLQSRRRKVAANALAQYWRALPEGGDVQVLIDAGFVQAAEHHQRLRDFAQSPAVRSLSERARQRLDHVLPALIEASAQSSAPDAALPRGLSLMQAITRRTSYLALLEEQPVALARLVDVVARSALLAERLAEHPLLLDELLDARLAAADIGAADVQARLQRDAAAIATGDTESALSALNEIRQSLAFRFALATLAQRLSAMACSRHLATLAQSLLQQVVALAEREMRQAHGEIAGAGFAVVAYGSVGGRELGFGSDLDLVFLHDARGDEMSDGMRPLEASRYFARLAQKLVSLLGTVTAAGRLYEVDVRLRPDGAKGLLVSTLESFSDYQQQRAWTWEQQALVRARAVAGDARVQAGFERIRREVLQRVRDGDVLRAEVIAMRARMRGELDRSDALRFDLKQGEGGLVDLEFLLQAQVLALAASHPELADVAGTPELIAAIAAAGGLEAKEVGPLRGAHALLLTRSLDCTLDQRPRLCPRDAELDAARAAVSAACTAHGLVFSAP